MSTISATLTFEAALGEAVLLSAIEGHRAVLSRQGIYFLHEGAPSTDKFDPYSDAVVYIGKAIGETIFSRCGKHRAALRDERLPSGKPSMRPGKRFKAWRTERQGSLENLFVVPAHMRSEEPYLISCAEEYLIHQYFLKNGAKPRANTK